MLFTLALTTSSCEPTVFIKWHKHSISSDMSATVARFFLTSNYEKYQILLNGFSKFSILIGWQAVRKNPYPDRGPYFPYLERCPGCHLPGGKFLLCKQNTFCFLNFQLCFTDKNFKQPNFFDWACMPTVYCYPVKLTIADLIRAKSICSQTQFSHIINRLLTSLVRSVLQNIRPLFFTWTSLLPRSVHTKKPRSDISHHRPHVGQ
jgi:hypothetical protein